MEKCVVQASWHLVVLIILSTKSFLLDLQFFIYFQLVIVVINVYFVELWTELHYSDSTQTRCYLLHNKTSHCSKNDVPVVHCVKSL